MRAGSLPCALLVFRRLLKSCLEPAAHHQAAARRSDGRGQLYPAGGGAAVGGRVGGDGGTVQKQDRRDDGAYNGATEERVRNYVERLRAVVSLLRFVDVLAVVLVL